MRITQAPPVFHDDGNMRRHLVETLKRVEPALGATAAALPDPDVVRAQLRRNSTGLASGVIGAMAAFVGLHLGVAATDEKIALMVLLIGLAFAGLALVGLFGLVGAWLENFALQRLALMQSRLDAAEENELAVAGFEGVTALREIRAWRSAVAQNELTDEVLVFVADRYAHAPIDALRARYGRIAFLARQAAPSEQSAQDLLSHLRPAGIDWPTNLAAAAQMADASERAAS